MNYSDYETAISSVRLNKYKLACGGDTNKAINLYRYNIRLGQKFYGLLNIFEVVLRNAIDRHYREYFNNVDWIEEQLRPGGMLHMYTQRETVQKCIDSLVQQGKYSQDRLVSLVSLGFWTYMFTKVPFRLGGQNLLKIFPNRYPGMGQKAIYKEMLQIKDFRNKIAHHDGICFDRNCNKCTDFSRYHYGLVIKYLQFLGYNMNELLFGLDVVPDSIMKKIDEL